MHLSLRSWNSRPSGLQSWTNSTGKRQHVLRGLLGVCSPGSNSAGSQNERHSCWGLNMLRAHCGKLPYEQTACPDAFTRQPSGTGTCSLPSLRCRFGVGQRARLQAKSSPPPHVLAMTATPIPRTLALAVHGDMAHCAIDELPPGRLPVKTHALVDVPSVREQAGLQALLHGCQPARAPVAQIPHPPVVTC